MGLLWSFLNPLLMLAVFTFVFSVVFKARWGVDGAESKADFALILFVGMIIHGVFAECVNRAPGLILGNVNFVKKVIFPLEILPWVAMGATLFHALVSVAVWAVFFLAVNGYLPWTIVFLPLVALPLVLVTMGFTWFLAATGVYPARRGSNHRDLHDGPAVSCRRSSIRCPRFRRISTLAPTQSADLSDRAGAGGHGLGARTGSSRAPLSTRQAALLVALLGLAWFQKTRRGFADVL